MTSPVTHVNETMVASRGTDSWLTSQTTNSGLRHCPVATGNSTGADEFYNTAQMVTGLFIYPVFCFPGLIGNILTLVVLSQRNMLNSTNAFLSALAVSDSIKLVNDILYFFVTLFLQTDATLGNQSYAYLYPYAHFIFSMSVCVSSWLTVSVAVERYILLCHPTRARNVWTRNMAVVLCCAVYVIMTSLALPSAFRYRTIECFDVGLNKTRLDVELTELWQNDVFVTSYTWAQNLLRSIIPLVVLVALNVCIIRAVRKTKGRKRKNSRHRVTVMMIVVIVTFLVCITPDAILSTVFGRGYHEAGKVTKAIREITDTLLTINAAVNFVIYCALNRVFRKSFARLCCPRRSQDSGWITEMDESIYRRLSEAKSSVLSNNNHGNHQQEKTSPVSPSTDANNSPTSPVSCATHTISGNSVRKQSSPISPGIPSNNCVHASEYSLGNIPISPAGEIEKRKISNDSNGVRSPRPRSFHSAGSVRSQRGQSSSGLRKSRNSVKVSRGSRWGSDKKAKRKSDGFRNDDEISEVVTYIPATEFNGNNSGRRRAGLQFRIDSRDVTNSNNSDKTDKSSPLVPPLKTTHEPKLPLLGDNEQNSNSKASDITSHARTPDDSDHISMPS